MVRHWCHRELARLSRCGPNSVIGACVSSQVVCVCHLRFDNVNIASSPAKWRATDTLSLSQVL